MTTIEFQLPSNSGREVTRWTVVATLGEGMERSLRCDVCLAGAFYGETLGSPASVAQNDFDLSIRGLVLGCESLQRLSTTLTEWLSLPLVEMRADKLELMCSMGGLFDQSLRLRLGDRDDVISSGRPVATLHYIVGRMQGELSYIVGPSCLEVFRNGIETALGEAGL